MRTVEIPPMPRFKLVFYLILLLVACALLGLMKWYGQLNEVRLWAITVGAMLSLFITTTTDLIPEAARRIGERSRRGRFKRFFGEAAFEQTTHLVFAYRLLKPSQLKDNPWVTFSNTPEGTSAEGVNAWLAFQDIRAATYLSNSLYEMTGKDVRLIHDKDIDGDGFNYCAISIGLGFNDFTHRLSEQCDKKLFEVVFGQSLKDPNFATDYFKIDGVCPEPPQNKDDCLVARIVLRPFDGTANRVCFVCAGRTASGTAAAGFFLARHWEQLMKLYVEHEMSLDLDSLAVVVRHTHDAFGHHEFDTTGVIEPDLVAWHRTPGLEAALPKRRRPEVEVSTRPPAVVK